MSPDPDPTDQLLDRHGKQWLTTFAPPPLEGMLAVATTQTHHRTRWLWPSAAAVALLVIPLLTVVGISGSHQSATRPAGFLGDADWIGAVLQTDPRMLTIAVNINETPNCLDNRLPDVRPVVSETTTKVTIRAQAFRPSPPSPTPTLPAGVVPVCALPGYRPMPVTVRLKQPLGTRSLIDAKTGIRHPVLDASTLLTPSWLPAGYVDLGFQWQTDSPQAVVREYDGPGGRLRVGRSPKSAAWSGEKTLTTATVLGHPARVFTYDTASKVRCVAWDDSEYSWSICSDGVEPPKASLSTEDVLRIAKSMR